MKSELSIGVLDIDNVNGIDAVTLCKQLLHIKG